MKNNTVITALTELGIGPNEAQLYEILLSLPQATIPEMQRKSNFSRTMLYYILEQLEVWDLVSKSKKGKKTIYIAAPPEKLQSIVFEQEKEIKRRKALLENVMVDLRSNYLLGHNKPGVRFFEGKEGFQEALEDTLLATETIYTFADIDAIIAYVNDINSAYVTKRKKKGIDKKLLVLDTATARSYMKEIGADHTSTRFLPKSLAPFSTGMQIYNNKISYFTLREDNIISVIIEDKDIYAMHRAMFEFFWNLQEKGSNDDLFTSSLSVFS